MIFAGDLHGAYPTLLYDIKRTAINNDNIIQVGDWGLGFTSQQDDVSALHRIDKFLAERNIRLYVIRGNHDNKWFWDHYAQLGLNYIQLVNDYTVITIDNCNLLCIGGGISIDRSSRRPGKDYWEDEVFKLNEILLKTVCSDTVDIVVSHIAPRSCWPYTLPPIVDYYIERENNVDRDLKTALEKERDDMETVLTYAKTAGVKEWYYGHYHTSMTEEINSIKFRCLDTGELFERR